MWAGLNENIFFLLEPRSLKASITYPPWSPSGGAQARDCPEKKPPDSSSAHRGSQGCSLQTAPKDPATFWGHLGKTGVCVQAGSGGSDRRDWDPGGDLLWPGAQVRLFQPRRTVAPPGLGGAHGSADRGIFLCLFFMRKTY